MQDLSEQILSLECDPSMANAVYASQKEAYREGHAAALIQAADVADAAPDAAHAAITFGLTLGCEVANFLDLWVGGDFETIRAVWPNAPQELYAVADPLFEPASAA
ncbi:hypothetical protein [Pseudomonas baetica]|jgi:hypothetical protein|uniref:hypothetical protein n=1 Tax=Pseudomonas baetica TaxID=674054 RepID=UPI0024057AB2|nr:hypothetical protein [Pseudomonas baetica]MDF9778772.1 hypothetical protein [Pseudomonas baetica]